MFLNLLVVVIDKRLVFILFFFVFSLSFAQNKEKVNVDSLYLVTKQKPHTKEKVDELIKLYRSSVRQREYNEAIIDEALLIAEDLIYIKGIANCYDRKGLTARYKSNFNESVKLHKRALGYFQNTNDTLSKLKCLNNLGVSYRKLNQGAEAYNYYIQALSLAEKINNRKSIAIANNGIGNTLVKAKDYDKAIEFLKKGFQEDVEYENAKHKEIGLSNIGEVFIAKKQYDSAYFYINKAMKIAIASKNEEGIAIKNSLLGIINHKVKQYKKAVVYQNKAIPILKKYNTKVYLSGALINKGCGLSNLKQYNQALNHINEGLELAKSIDAYEDIKIGYRALVNHYTRKNDLKQALAIQNKASVFQDSIHLIESKNSIVSSQVSFESLRKDEQLRNLAKAKEKGDQKASRKFKNLLYGLFLSLIFSAGLIVLYFLNKRNVELELDNRNKEIQNYLLQIKKLKNNISDNNENNNGFEEKFENYNLSKREQEVFTHISNGLTNEEIAEKLFLSKNTIKTHIKNIYAKLDVKNRIQALKKLDV